MKESQVRVMFTPREIGAQLAVTDETVKAMIQRGELPGCKVGAQWRIPAAAYEEWVRAKTEAASKGARS